MKQILKRKLFLGSDVLDKNPKVSFGEAGDLSCRECSGPHLEKHLNQNHEVESR